MSKYSITPTEWTNLDSESHQGYQVWEVIHDEFFHLRRFNKLAEAEEYTKACEEGLDVRFMGN